MNPEHLHELPAYVPGCQNVQEDIVAEVEKSNDLNRASDDSHLGIYTENEKKHQTNLSLGSNYGQLQKDVPSFLQICCLEGAKGRCQNDFKRALVKKLNPPPPRDCFALFGGLQLDNCKLNVVPQRYAAFATVGSLRGLHYEIIILTRLLANE